MRNWSFIICCLMLFGAVLSARSFFQLENKSDGILTGLSLAPPIFTYGDIAITASGISNKIYVMRRNSEGFYEQTTSISVPAMPSEVSTDGSWFSVSIPDTYHVQVFQLDAEGSPINVQQFNSERDCARLISPNTLVVVNDSYLTTFEHDGSSWNRVDESLFPIEYYMKFYAGYEPYRLTKDSFVGLYDYRNEGSLFAFIMQRNANKTWSLFDTVNITLGGTGYPQHSTWNGVDTLIVSQESVLYTYTRQSPGVWSRDSFVSYEYGFLPIYFGMTGLLLDSNNYLVSAPYQNVADIGLPGGAVTMLHRDGPGSSWKFVADFGQFLPRDRTVGLGLVKNDQDILVYSCFGLGESNYPYNCSFMAYPACFLEPINMTCPSSAALDQCDEVDVADFITVNNSPTCGQISSSGLQMGLSPEGLQFSVTLARPFVAPVTCSVAVTCPQPPVTVTPVAPTTECPPTTTSGNTPVVLTPSSAKTSSATGIVFDAIVLVVLACFSF